jgi:hypothetical protein
LAALTPGGRQSISDFNGDRTSDVLWFNPANDTVSDWLMNNGIPTPQFLGESSPTANIAGFGDFTGTGTSDILWENPTNGVVGDWLMSNNQPTWQQIGLGSTTMNIAGVGASTATAPMTSCGLTRPTTSSECGR